MHQQFEYDVCLSYASEQRGYVRKVKDELIKAGLNSFFDEDEQTEMWGKNLTETLDEIYRKKCRFCVMFISAEYARKMWTNHERQSAQARALKDHNDYLLPARFDDTEIKGLPPTIAYIDLRQHTSETFAQKIIQKVKAVGYIPKEGIGNNQTEDIQSGAEPFYKATKSFFIATPICERGKDCLSPCLDKGAPYELDMFKPPESISNHITRVCANFEATFGRVFPVKTFLIYIYSPPCYHALKIASAFYTAGHRFFHSVRVDNRLSANCCPPSSVHKIMESLLSKAQNPSGGDIYMLQVMDLEWLEQRVHYSKEENQEDDDPFSVDMLFQLHQNDNQCAAILVISDAEHCNSLATRLPVVSNKKAIQGKHMFELVRISRGRGTPDGWKPTYVLSY